MATGYQDAHEAAKNKVLITRTEVAIKNAALEIHGQVVTADPPTKKEIRLKRMARAWRTETQAQAKDMVRTLIYSGATIDTDAQLDAEIAKNIDKLSWDWDEDVTERPVGRGV